MAQRYAQASALRQREQANAMLMGLGGVSIPGRKVAPPPIVRARKVSLEPPAVRRLREKIATRGLHGMHDLVRLLRVMDDNGDGVLTRDELKFGLEDLGVRINDVELIELFQYFDRDDNGTISQQEFLRGVRGPMPKAREACVLDAFASLDHTRDGCVTLEEIELAYDASRHPLVRAGQQTPAQALREFLRRWDHLEDDTEATLDEFVEYHKNLSAMILRDEDFVSLVRALWRLDSGETGIGACAEEAQHPSENLGTVSNMQVRGPETLEKPMRAMESQAARAQRHPDGPRPGKPSVPKWIRFDGVTLGFSLYHKETTRAHAGRFNPQTRVFDTEEVKNFRVRTFVLRYYLEDDSVAVSETTQGQGRLLQFMGRAKTPLELRDLIVGNTVSLKGLQMHVVDADKKARDYMKEIYPDLRMLPGMPVPKEPISKEESRKQQQQQQQQQQQNSVRAPRAPGARTTSRQFIENDGKVMQFLCTWEDPSAGDLRKFKLLYYLCDDTLELREVNERNSGRERQALLNLNRQRLANPANRDCAPYRPENLYVGATINAFGRAMRVVECDRYAKRFLEDRGLPVSADSESVSTSSHRRSSVQGAPPPTVPLGLYSDAVDQKLKQILDAIRATTEQRTRFGTRFDQMRMLRAYLKRFADTDYSLYHAREGETGIYLDRAGFTSAMAGFSCFGSDCELLFDRLQFDQKKRNVSTELDGSDLGVRDSWPPKHHHQQQQQRQPCTAEDKPVRIAAQTIIDAVYGKIETAADAAAESSSTASVRTPASLPPRVEGLVRAIRDKLEVSTNFGEECQQKRVLMKILQTACVGATSGITRSQFRGAMAQLNCWERDAHALFDAFDDTRAGRLECHALVDAIFASSPY